VARSVDFYRTLLGLDVHVDHGWYAELGSDGRVLVAFVERGHQTVPAVADASPRGVLVSFEVDDAVAHEAIARAMGQAFVLSLTRELGQVHFMLVDPDGVVIDVIERVPLAREDVRRLVRLRRARA
jgi:catechol 2,3-dioxygenase-like lactoylglutathione lyase family enzyme